MIDFLLEGMTITEAAKAAEVHRSTIHNWLNDPVFTAEYRSAMTVTYDIASNLLIQGACAAVETVNNAIKAGDTKLAFKWLEKMGLFSDRGVRVGSTDPEVIRLHQQKRELEKEAQKDNLKSLLATLEVSIQP